MKRLTLIEILVALAVIAIIVGAVAQVWRNPNAFHAAPDGTMIYSVEIDGHDYLKTATTLTHSAACRACSQKER